MKQPTITLAEMTALYLCAHTPTGTVAWPDPDTYFANPNGPGKSVYSCADGRCIDRCSQFVHTRTGQPGTYRPFPPGATG
jgi:hypothetical protein